MKILVCIKQVPGSNNVEVDPVTGVLKRSGIASKINPYDLYGIETALTLAEKYGGKVDSITMGPPQAKAVINETVAMGASLLSQIVPIDEKTINVNMGGSNPVSKTPKTSFL